MSNKKVIKNASMLYVRMLVMLLVSLYTSRVVLSTLGVTDFGIYNVTGGIVLMFAFISNTMASASQRFFAYEIGKGNSLKLKKLFSVTVYIYIIFSIIILIIAETIGLWFVESKLNIPPDRLDAALFVYHVSVISFVFTILRIPYNSCIIAHERMSFFATTSIIEACLKLSGVYVLTLFSFDKLKLYSIVMLLVVIAITFTYFIFCKRKFEETKLIPVKDKSLYKEISSYAGWNSFTTLANIGLDQGINILINIFFGPVVNAARSVSFQIKTQVTAFVGNIQMAAAPKIIKLHASGELNKMEELVYLSSRITYYFMLFIGLPIILEAGTILKIWLVNVPDHAELFTKLIIVNILIETVSGTVTSAIQATGRIKAYQIIVGFVLLTAVPLSYMLLSIGYAPEVTVIITCILSIVCVYIRLIIFKMLFKLKISDYINKVILNGLLVTCSSFVLPLFLKNYLTKIDASEYFTFVTVCGACALSTITSVYFLGLNHEEKKLAKSYVKKLINR